MSKELADSIVIAARRMEHNKVEVISVIRYSSLTGFSIRCPETKNFSSFEKAYNYLAKKGYQEVSQDKDTHFKKLLVVVKHLSPVFMIMSMKVNKE
jgi:hypothetical protein